MNRLVYCLLLVLLHPSISQASESIEVLIDLSGANFNDNVYKLDGEWEFYWQEFTQSDGPSSDYAIVNVPHSWDRDYPTYGYATYKTTVILPQSVDKLALKIRRVKMAHRLYIDGQLMASFGNATKSPEAFNEKHVPYIYEFNASGLSRIEISLEVANFSYLKSGLTQSIMIGSPANIRDLREQKIFTSTFVCGALFIIAVYHIFFFLARRKDKEYLFFSLFCLPMSIRMLFSDEKYGLTLFPFIPNDTFLAIELWTVFFALPMLHLYIYHLYPNEFYLFRQSSSKNRKPFALKITYTYLITTNVVWLTTPLSISSRIIYPFELYVLFIFVHIALINYRSIRRSRQGSLLFFVGFMCVFFTGVNDILHERSYINTFFMFRLGALAFVLFQAVLLSQRIARAFNEVENFNITLEQKVRSRTAELEQLVEKNRRLNKYIITSLESERKHIGNEMHDSVNSQIIGAKYSLMGVMNSKLLPDILKPDIQRVASKLGEIYENVRGIVKNLRPEVLDALGLKGALMSIIEENRKQHPDKVYSASIDDEVNRLDENVRITLFRISQEALSNISKHSNATEVFISLVVKGDGIEMCINDNGIGIQDSGNEGVGLISMKERASLINGEFYIASEEGKGTSVKVNAPHTRI